jgi:hypothetical protein
VEHEFSTVVLAADLGIADFTAMIFSYTAFEGCMALKAQVLLWAMEQFPNEDTFLYLDCDTFAYSEFSEVASYLSTADILLTPHHVHDEETLEGISDNMVRTLACGTFNSGFVGVRRSPAAQAFLDWWTSKLRRFCYCDPHTGLFHEQKWLDLAPSFFDITVLREPGYNVANWNVSKRHITTTTAGYMVNGTPLRFFHYSMADSCKDIYYLVKYSWSESPILEMRTQYTRAVKRYDIHCISTTPWSYGCFASGEPIADSIRRKVRQVPALLKLFPDPFAASNSEIAFPLKSCNGALHS